MNIGISSAVFYPLETEKAIEQIIDLGFKKAEVFLNCESEFEDSFIDKIKEMTDSAGVEIISVHPYTSLIEGMCFFSGYNRRVDDCLESYRKYFRATNRLGAKYFTFHGNRTLTGTVTQKLPIEHHIEVISRLATAAKEYGVLLTQENVSWCSSKDPDYIRALRDALGGEIGYTFDIKQARRAGVDIQEYIRAMGSDLKNIHISDFTQSQPCLLPGEGDADFEEILEMLKEIGYNGELLIEVYESNYRDICQILEAKKYLEMKILQKNA